MDTQLHKQRACKNVEELKARLETVRQSIPASMLHALVDGMRGRMQHVIQLSGDHIGR